MRRQKQDTIFSRIEGISADFPLKGQKQGQNPPCPDQGEPARTETGSSPEETRQSAGRDHPGIWSELYDSLSSKETDALYNALTKAAYRPGEPIFEQGEWKSRLYFINRGRAKIVYFQDGRENFLKTVQPGQLAGEESFFSYMVRTTSMIAESALELSYIDSDLLDVWRTTCPELEAKLKSFASNGEKVADLLKAGEVDRRRHRRINVAGKAKAFFLDSPQKQAGKNLKVGLCDISRGGLCLTGTMTKRETAGMLLGKRLRIGYSDQIDSYDPTGKMGTVVGVRFSTFEHCNVSVKFDALLPEEVIVGMERVSSAS